MYIDIMGMTFKDFICRHNFSCSLIEQESAPSGETAKQPDNPRTTNKHHFSFLKKELGIDDDSFDAAMEGNSIPVFKVPDYSKKWGFLVIGPCTATVEKRSDGNYLITYQLLDKHLMDPHSFIYPYKKGENPMIYNGDVEDKTETISAEEFQDILAKASQSTMQSFM